VSGFLKKSVKSRTSDQTYIEGLKQFNKYGDLFQDLTRRTYVDTKYDVVSMMITYDSLLGVAIVIENDETFYLQAYNLDTNERVFNLKYSGKYLKMNIVEQTLDGKLLACCYQDNGKYRVTFIDNTGNELDNLDVSELI
jgi:hypothetical protein